MKFFRIRNFDRFQHYADRRPPWIKLYRDLWDDPRFFSLSDGERYALISLFVVASQHDNKVPADTKWLKAKLLTKAAIPLEKLVATEWIEWVEQDAITALAASNAQADCYPSRAGGETETEVQRQNIEIQIPHGEFGHCLLTAEQSEKLRTQLNGRFDHWVRKFDRWVHEAPNAKSSGVKRKDRNAYLSILNWSEDDRSKEKKVNGTYQQGESAGSSGKPKPPSYTPRQ